MRNAIRMVINTTTAHRAATRVDGNPLRHWLSATGLALGSLGARDSPLQATWLTQPHVSSLGAEETVPVSWAYATVT